MTVGSPPDPAVVVHRELVTRALGPYFATPCGVLAPLLELLADEPDYQVVAREDNAVGLAAGVGLAGGAATVLMQNSGLGQSVNALASLVVPYAIPMLLVISLRGTGPDVTAENRAMGRLTEPILDGLGIGREVLGPGDPSPWIARAEHAVRGERRPFALLVPPGTFGWDG